MQIERYAARTPRADTSAAGRTTWD